MLLGCWYFSVWVFGCLLDVSFCGSVVFVLLFVMVFFCLFRIIGGWFDVIVVYFVWVLSWFAYVMAFVIVCGVDVYWFTCL